MKRLLGILGWLGVALVSAAVILRFVRPELPQWYQRLALAGLIVTAVYALTQWRDIGRSFRGRNVKYGSIAASSVVLVFAILVGINWVASRQNKRWDLTATGEFSLSDQTQRILAELEQPVAIRAFYTGSSEPYRDQLSEYAYLSSQVSVEYVDADRNPVEAQKYGITTVPTFILEYAGRSERAMASDEQTITNALKKVIEGTPKKAYFVQGHGEIDPEAPEPSGYSGITAALRNDNFETTKLQLAQTGAVPDDATVVVVAGPRTDLLAPEVDALRAFLDRGGKLLLLVDPPEKGAGDPLTNLLALARDWGIEIGSNLVVDVSGLGQLIGTDASVPVAMPVAHAITENFRVMSAFPLARSVTPIPGGAAGRTAQSFLQTSPQSWAESDIAGLYASSTPERNLDQGDLSGPVSIAAAVSAPAAGAPAGSETTEPAEAAEDTATPEARIVVVGDSDFASNRALGIQGNRDLFLNVMNWLAQQEDLIAIRPRDPYDRPITMTADQGSMVFWFTMIVVPGLLFLNGIRVWWRKR